MVRKNKAIRILCVDPGGVFWFLCWEVRTNGKVVKKISCFKWRSGGLGGIVYIIIGGVNESMPVYRVGFM